MNNLKSRYQYLFEAKLTQDEKDYLWKKLENRKKKKAEADKDSALYKMLKGDKKTLSEEDFLTLLKSLEYTFRKRLKDVDNPMKNDTFISIQKKLPETWTGISYSGLKPNSSNTTEEIKIYLKAKKIKFEDSMKKSALVKLIKQIYL